MENFPAGFLDEIPEFILIANLIRKIEKKCITRSPTVYSEDLMFRLLVDSTTETENFPFEASTRFLMFQNKIIWKNMEKEYTAS